MTRRPRVAIYGGDDRSERLDWPRHLDVQFYPYKSPRAADRLKESLSSGSVDHLVILTSYMGHGFESSVRSWANNCNVIRWPQSPGQLSRKLGEMIPPTEQPVNPLLTPTRQDHPGTGGGRGPLMTKEAQMAESEKNIPMFEHVVPVPPAENETLGQALQRILRAEGIGQSELGRLIHKDASTVNGWIKDRNTPRDMGPLVDLWPELARFDKERTYAVAPTAAEAEVKAADELKDLIRGIKAEPKATPVAVPQPDPGRLINPELAATMARWRKQKEDLETTERYLLMLLRDAGF